MTYIISLALMASGLALLTWTFVAALRLRKERSEIAFSGLGPSFPVPISVPPRREHVLSEGDSRHPVDPSRSDWYQLQCKASRGVRYAPDMGGFTEVPLQLQDQNDNTMYVRKRIWVN